MKHSQVKAIIFDCDGTLIDSEGSHFYAWQKIAISRNYFFSFDDFLHCMGNANPSTAQMMATKMNVASPQELLDECNAYYKEYAQHEKNTLKPIPHTVDFLHKLAKEKDRLGIKLAVASAASKGYILKNLKLIGIENIFDLIISGQDDLHDYTSPEGVNKPNPHIYLHTAKLLGVEPSSCIVLEDSLPGLTAGIRAGCFTIAIPTHSTKIQDLSAADLKLRSLEGLSIEQFFHLVEETRMRKAITHTPTVIFLNGTSSAGKTTTVQHLQAQLDTPFLHIGIDHFLFMLPERYRMDGEESHLGYCFRQNDDEEGAKTLISKGPYADKINAVKASSIENLLNHQFNLIIDEVLFAEDDFQMYLELLKHSKVYFISIKPPITVAESREKTRGGRMLGLARGLYHDIYHGKIFDLEIDTSQLTPEEVARKIVEYVHDQPHPHAFKQNLMRFAKL